MRCLPEQHYLTKPEQVTVRSPLRLPQFPVSWIKALQEVSVSIVPTVSLCPYIAPTSHKRSRYVCSGPTLLRTVRGSETGPSADKTRVFAFGHTRTTKLTCPAQRRTGWHLEATASRAATCFINANSLLYDGRTGERCLYRVRQK